MGLQPSRSGGSWALRCCSVRRQTRWAPAPPAQAPWAGAPQVPGAGAERPEQRHQGLVPGPCPCLGRGRRLGSPRLLPRHAHRAYRPCAARICAASGGIRVDLRNDRGQSMGGARLIVGLRDRGDGGGMRHSAPERRSGKVGGRCGHLATRVPTARVGTVSADRLEAA